MKLSVIIPTYNEDRTIETVITRVLATELVHEIIVVDDGSQDASVQIVQRLQQDAPSIHLLQHPQNRGKGAAIRTGLASVTGELVLVQDADLEYDPADYPALLAPFNDPAVQVVYGSRNLQRNEKSTLAFYWGGRLLSWVTNLLYGSAITDEATGYKVIQSDLLRDIGVDTDGFEFCPEITGKLLRRGIKIPEVPISYHPRTREEGKKIQWYDGPIAIWTLLKYRFEAKNLRELLNLLMVFVVLLAAFLRLPYLSSQSIAFDESFSLVVGQAKWGLLFQALLSDGVHPPLFYIIHKGALALWGVSEFGQRFSAAGFSILTVALTYKAGYIILNRYVGILGALLLALNPLQIWFSQEARMYSLLSALTLLSMIFFWQAIQHNRWQSWVGLTLANMLIYLLHYFGFLIPAIQFLFIGLTFARNFQRLRSWTLSQFVAILPLIPWLILTASRDQQTFGIGFLQRPNLLDLFVSLWNLTLGSSNLFWPLPLLFLLVTVVILAAAFRPLPSSELLPRQARLLLLVWFLFPILITWLVSQRRAFYADRYLTFTIPALLLLGGYGLTRIKAMQWQIGLTTAVLLGSVWGIIAMRLDRSFWKDDWRQVGRYIGQNEQPDDAILLYTTHIKFVFDYYYPGQVTTTPLSLNLENFPLAPLLENRGRAWVVYPYTRRPTHYPMQPLQAQGYWLEDPQRNPLLVEWLTAQADNVVEYQHFRGIEVWLVDLK